jgi:hypothetical protein
VALHPDDKDKTAFSTGQGLWQFTVLPFGLCDAPAVFKRPMESVLGGLICDTNLVYLDDAILVSRNMRKVFQRFRETHLRPSANYSGRRHDI